MADEEYEYVVEKVLAKRKTSFGSDEYKVLWEGYTEGVDEGATTWEPEETLVGWGYEELIRTFNRKRQGRPPPTGRGRGGAGVAAGGAAAAATSNDPHAQPMANSAPMPMVANAPQPMAQMGAPFAQQMMIPPPLGFSSEPGPEDKCFCCPHSGCGNKLCCTYPIFFCTQDRSFMAPEAQLKLGCCTNEARMDNVQILNTQVSFHYQGASCPCSTSLVTVSSNGRPIGNVVHDPRCCLCSSDHKAVVATLANSGQVRFQRIEPCCYDGGFYTQYPGCCGHAEKSWPIADAYGLPLGMISARQHACCGECYPNWVGFRQWPVGAVTQEDHMLLMGIALMRWINMSRNSQKNNRHGGPIQG